MKRLAAWGIAALLFGRTYAEGREGGEGGEGPAPTDNRDGTGLCAAVDYQRTGTVTEEAIGVYDEFTDCTLTEGGSYTETAYYQRCFRKDDDSTWRIWNSGCGWLVGYRDTSDTWITVATSSCAGDCSTSDEDNLNNLDWCDTTGSEIGGAFQVNSGSCSMFDRPDYSTTGGPPCNSEGPCSTGGGSTTGGPGPSGSGEPGTTGGPGPSGTGEPGTTGGPGPSGSGVPTTTGTGTTGTDTTGTGTTGTDTTATGTTATDTTATDTTIETTTTSATSFFVTYTVWQINVTVTTSDIDIIQGCLNAGPDVVADVVEQTLYELLNEYDGVEEVNNITANYLTCDYTTTPTDNQILFFQYNVVIFFTYVGSSADGANQADAVADELEVYMTEIDFTENLNLALQATYPDSQVTSSGVQIEYTEVPEAYTQGEDNKGNNQLWIIGAIIIGAIIVLAAIIYLAVNHVNRRKQKAQIADDELVTEDRVARLQSVSDHQDGVDPLAIGVIGATNTSAFGEANFSSVPIINADQCDQMDINPVIVNVQPDLLSNDETGKVLMFNEGPVPTIASIPVHTDTNQQALGEDDSDEDVPAKPKQPTIGGAPVSI